MLFTVPVVRFLLGSWSSLSVLFSSASAKLIGLSLFRKRSLGSRFPLVELNQLVLADWVYSGLTKFLFYLGQWQLLFSLESELWLFIVKQFAAYRALWPFSWFEWFLSFTLFSGNLILFQSLGSDRLLILSWEFSKFPFLYGQSSFPSWFAWLFSIGSAACPLRVGGIFPPFLVKPMFQFSCLLVSCFSGWFVASGSLVRMLLPQVGVE